MCSLKRNFLHYLICATLILGFASCNNKNSKTEISTFNHDSITKAELKEWQDGKLGMFIHFGLYSIPAGVWNGERVPFYAEQIMNHARIPVNEYEKLAKKFNPEFWDAEEVVKLAKDAGMSYIVITSKHHDGFCLFKTDATKYNVVDATPYGKDIIKELADACEKYGVKLGLYYSIPDWHYPGGIKRGTPDNSTKCYEHVNQLYSPLEIVTQDLENLIVMQLTELLTNYGEIETIWFDMGLVTPEQSKRFRKTVKSIQPKCLINGRIMNNQGDYITLPDNGNVADYSNIAWDNPASMYSTWGYRIWQRHIDKHQQAQIQLGRLVKTVTNGGVFLLNTGPKGDGSISNYEKDVFLEIGKWVEDNKEAIYNTEPSPFIKLDGASCSKKDNKLYFIVTDSIEKLDCHNLVSKISKLYLLNDTNTNFTTKKIEQGVRILLPTKQPKIPYTIVAEFANDSIIVEPFYITENDDHSYTLNEENAITHSAIDGTGYMSIQLNSYKSWNVNIKEGGNYHIFVDYLPIFDQKEYVIKTKNKNLYHTFPGVDKMIQTTYVGNTSLRTGKQTIVLDATNKCDVLEELGLENIKITLRKY